ncbi:TspO/MBR family protein [Guptibacillus algicola]|uniref:TspO/MBR family protein n=1 Tax=Guptibacillus algicola TaxID=225844 RepID=UPI001CD58B74|nr:TspO/MBR family protein [Alkalihalobacillus algicola]MCA0987795.1 tryptophan-rich sensory protein [Alkalihalobacillus algicola]
MKKSTVLVFFVTYGLFSLSGFLFPYDPDWYTSLSKPEWTPAGAVIGGVWAILFALISLSVALIYQTYGFGRHNSEYLSLLSINYLLNQAFSFFQFQQHQLFASFLDALLLAVTTFALIFLSGAQKKLAGWLLVPYFLWTSFATYLSWVIYVMNR